MNTAPNPHRDFDPQADHPQKEHFTAMENSDRLSCWLQTSQELLRELMSRKRLLDRLHPHKNVADDEAEILEIELTETEKDIAGLCRQIAELEDAAPLLGSRVLIGENPPDIFRAAIAVLVLSRLSCAYDWEFDTVGLVCGLVSGGNPDKALPLRNSFRFGGELRRHVNIERRTNNIDHWRVGLTEASLSAALGESPDAEQLAVSMYHEIHDARRKGSGMRH